MKKWILLLFIVSSNALAEPPAKKDTAVDPIIKQIIEKHLQRYGKSEQFSAIQVSIKEKGKLQNYPVGRRSLSDKSELITAENLFDIGSISKSFTAALVVIAERDKKVELKEPLGKYLVNYPQWSEISLAALLNMSSGLPNYTDAPKLNYLISKNLRQYWNAAELIALVYPKDSSPPLRTGYFYCNTGYVLIGMILTKTYSMPFAKLLEDKILKPLELENTFYPVPNYSAGVLTRLVDGYSYNIYNNPELLGKQVKDNNLSWAGAAGGMVANSEDVIHWVEHLFITNKLLTKNEKKKMQQLISLSSGKPIKRTDKHNSRGFGLGIIQSYDPKIGRFWFYEGETFGYRALYMYVPAKKIIISALFNSATNHENDHANELLQALYHQVVKG